MAVSVFQIFLFLVATVSAAPCESWIQSNFTAFSYANVDGAQRTYLVGGCADVVPSAGLPIVLALHGGTEYIHYEPVVLDGMDGSMADYSGLFNISAVVVMILGQPSNNGRSWSAAFPWRKSTTLDDIAAVDTILTSLKSSFAKAKIDWGRIYAVGKSDGAGQAMQLACTPSTKFPVQAVASISGAHFGLNSVTNFGSTSYSNICVPSKPMPVLLVHGDNDPIMNYTGQNTVSAAALAKYNEGWIKVDTKVTNTSSNTFTANIVPYAKALALANSCGQVTSAQFSTYTTVQDYKNCKASTVLFTVSGGVHTWTGRSQSAPLANNNDIDVTTLVSQWLNIDYSRYNLQSGTKSNPTYTFNSIITSSGTSLLSARLSVLLLPLLLGLLSVVSQ